MKRYQTCLSFVTLLACVAHLSCSRPSGNGSGDSDKKLLIQGAGSTFAAPLYRKWSEAYAAVQPDVRIKYDPVGSGEGEDRFAQGNVDFAGTDTTLTPERLLEIRRGALMLPIATGGIVLAYNSHGMSDGLKLPRDVYVDIFLGKITRWTDPRIRAANPGAPLLVDRPIAVVSRRDSSGTTYAFTKHLSAISESWREGPGVGKSVSWPAEFQRVPGNEQVAGRIKVSYGAIGYVEYGTAHTAGLYMARLENKQGEFIAPSCESCRLGVAAVGNESSQFAALQDPEANGAYPIVTGTWLLLYKRYGDDKRAMAVREFARWCLSDGQNLSEPLGYVRLNHDIAAHAAEEASSIVP